MVLMALATPVFGAVQRQEVRGSACPMHETSLHEMMKAETGRMCPQAKLHHGLLAPPED